MFNVALAGLADDQNNFRLLLKHLDMVGVGGSIRQLAIQVRPKAMNLTDPCHRALKEQILQIADVFAADVEPAQSIENLVEAAAPVVPPVFDHNAWGDLTVYEDDDMDYVATKKGVDIQLIKRARRLQMLDKKDV